MGSYTVEMTFEWFKPWLTTCSAAAVAFVVLIAVKTIVWSRVHAIAARTANTWDDQLLSDLNAPFRVLILAVSISIGLEFAPENFRHADTFQTVISLFYILVGGWVVDKLLKFVLAHHKFFKTLASSTKQLIQFATRILVLIIGGMIALDTLGISITPLLASLGVGSVAVALALQDTLSNFFSGVYVLADRPIRVDDNVQLEDGTEGTVTKIGWRSTHIRKLDNNVVVVPNTQIASSKIINYNFPGEEMSCYAYGGVSYDADLGHVEQVIIDVGSNVLKTIPGGVENFVPIVRFKEFGDSSINFLVVLKVKSFVNQYLIKHEFLKALHKRFNEEGIEIPFPQRVLHQPTPSISPPEGHA